MLCEHQVYSKSDFSVHNQIAAKYKEGSSEICGSLRIAQASGVCLFFKA